MLRSKGLELAYEKISVCGDEPGAGLHDPGGAGEGPCHG